VFRFRSISLRIVLLHAMAIITTAIVLPLVLYLLLYADIEELQHGSMQVQAEALAREIEIRPDNSVVLNTPRKLRDQYSAAYGRYAYAILDENGRVLLSSRGDNVAIAPIDKNSDKVTFFEISGVEQPISGASLRKEIGGRYVWVQVSEDLAHRDVLVDDVVGNFLRKVGWTTIPILLALLAIDIFILRRSMRPLIHASEQAQHISVERLDTRLPTADIPSEIRPLVIAINQALERVEIGVKRQREFAADVAHELRTPLAVLQARVDVLADRLPADQLQRDIANMSRVVSQLLDAAEMESIIVDNRETFDLKEVSADVVSSIAPLALAQGKSIAFTAPEDPVVVAGNAEMLRRAVRNLVENALSHTPEGTALEIVVDGRGCVSVLDEGPGVPHANRDLIFERFWRRDGSKGGGVGLGLAIVKRIVNAHGGSVSVENRPARGANFTIALPLAPPGAQLASSLQPSS